MPGFAPLAKEIGKAATLTNLCSIISKHSSAFDVQCCTLSLRRWVELSLVKQPVSSGIAENRRADVAQTLDLLIDTTRHHAHFFPVTLEMTWPGVPSALHSLALIETQLRPSHPSTPHLFTDLLSFSESRVHYLRSCAAAHLTLATAVMAPLLPPQTHSIIGHILAKSSRHFNDHWLLKRFTTTEMAMLVVGYGHWRMLEGRGVAHFSTTPRIRTDHDRLLKATSKWASLRERKVYAHDACALLWGFQKCDRPSAETCSSLFGRFSKQHVLRLLDPPQFVALLVTATKQTNFLTKSELDSFWKSIGAHLPWMIGGGHLSEAQLQVLSWSLAKAKSDVALTILNENTLSKKLPEPVPKLTAQQSKEVEAQFISSYLIRTLAQ